MNKFLEELKLNIRNLRDQNHILQKDTPQSSKGQIKNINFYFKSI